MNITPSRLVINHFIKIPRVVASQLPRNENTTQGTNSIRMKTPKTHYICMYELCNNATPLGICMRYRSRKISHDGQEAEAYTTKNNLKEAEAYTTKKCI